MAGWQLQDASISARHEAGMVKHGDALYLIGGRGERPIDIMQSSTWLQSNMSLPMKLHHFQPVSLNDNIYVLAAFTGPWPDEVPVANVLAINPKKQQISSLTTIPKDRRRGAAGVATYKNNIYVVGGITHGHRSGSVNWFDRFNPVSGKWTTMPDAPQARDHFNAVVVDDKLYALAGRRTSFDTDQSISLTESIVDVFDFKTQSWTSLPYQSNLPTPRAGNMAIAYKSYIIVVGGESDKQSAAHNDVEIFDTNSLTWFRLSDLKLGRHGGGLAIIENQLVAVSGSGKAGGEPELANVEVFSLDLLDAALARNVKQNEQQYFGKRFEQVILDIKGPKASEKDVVNPFRDYLYQIKLTHSSGEMKTIRGYFAADGNAQHTSANAGTIWRAHFVPEISGEWQFKGTLYQAKNVALNTQAKGKIVGNISGQINVGNSPRSSSQFAQNGFIRVKNGLFNFTSTNKFWLKGGSNSPENLLGYWQIDGTYRASKQTREGEASSGEDLHRFANHVQDWEIGDPLWNQTDASTGKGKGLIGAINYLTSQGMNTQYFLTMNIDGDGRDVWPYIDHKTFDRFDVSKLAQWNVIFQHMQNKGMLLHVVTQETENERMLDEGNTGELRQLYYYELIARFSHHLALVWNLGEENGPAEWSPIAQDDQQRIDMTAFFAQHDPYSHPIVIHSHSTKESKDKLLKPLLQSELDGISFQVEDREFVFAEIAKWRSISRSQSKRKSPWLITMDEIGKWHTGAKVDADDPLHDSLRSHVLWGTILAGGAGLEWYFGAKQPHNDLTAEDFRVRESLWKLTNNALTFFTENVDYWRLNPILNVDSNAVYAAQTNNINSDFQYVAYTMTTGDIVVELSPGEFTIFWFDPVSGKKSEQQTLTIDNQSPRTVQRPKAFKSVTSELVLLIKQQKPS